MCQLCSECALKIMSYGQPSYTIFKHTLHATLHGGGLVITNSKDDKKHMEVIKFLESKGYVITTEVSKNEIGCITNYTNAFWHEDGNYLCWCEQPSFSVDE